MTKTDELLSIQFLAANLKISYATLRRYAEARGVAERMGGVRVPGRLGLRYPASSLNQWRRLADLHAARAVTPQTAAAALDAIQGNEAVTDRATPEAARHPALDDVQIAQGFARIAMALERLAAAQERLAAAHEKIDRRQDGPGRVVVTVEAGGVEP